MSEAVPFNALAYTKRLKRSKIPADNAEAHAEALTEFLQDAVATKRDLTDVERRLTSAIEKAELRLVIKLGSIVAVGIGLLLTLEKLF